MLCSVYYKFDYDEEIGGLCVAGFIVSKQLRFYDLLGYDNHQYLENCLDYDVI